MSRKSFETAAAKVVSALGPICAKDLVGLLAQQRSRDHIMRAIQTLTGADALDDFLMAVQDQRVPAAEAAAYLRGYVSGWTRRREESEVRTVWSGPRTAGVPSRATAQVLVEVIDQTSEELVAMTYSARAYKPLTKALRSAVERGVRVDIVVETKSGATGLLNGPEPAAAFAAVPGGALWHWPAEARTPRRSRQHAKIAVADSRLLFLGSANLTASGATRNIEAGVLVRGGTAPQRAAEHVPSCSGQEY